MSRFVVASDIHLHNWSSFASVDTDGVNTRLAMQLSELKRAASRLDAGQRLYVAGDLFHVRGTIATEVLNPTIKAFDEIARKGIEIRIIPGNHDLALREVTWNSSAVSALSSIQGVIPVNGIGVFDDDRVVMVPWMESIPKLKTELIALGEDYRGWDLIIHAPMDGVLSGVPSHGLNPVDVGRFGFNRVFCGHYHQHRDFGNGVYSIGATTHQTWGDVGALAGFLIVDNAIVKRVPTQAPMFVEADPSNPLGIDGNYVRVKVDDATSAQIEALRASIMELGAREVVISSVPKPRVATRLGSIRAGASILDSVSDYVNKMDVGALDRATIIQAALSVLSEASAP